MLYFEVNNKILITILMFDDGTFGFKGTGFSHISFRRKWGGKNLNQ